jgi:Fe-S-cluster-containing dehydrogenase component
MQAPAPAAIAREGRRDFLRQAASSAGGAALILAFGGEGARWLSGRPARAGEVPVASGYDIARHDYLYLIDINKCIGCGSCVRACSAENDVPLHHFRTWVERYMVSRTGHTVIDSPNGGLGGFDPAPDTGDDVTKAFFVPKLCNHCTNTPCVQLCPVGASYRTRDGVVLVDEKRCIGCGYCVQACPYGSRFISPVTHTATKCTLCYHRITKGLLPMCVQACPTGARRFGDRKRPGDPVVEMVATMQVRKLKPELLTEPNCYYLGMGQEVR